jgi:flagellar biosynthetic protein FlhB
MSGSKSGGERSEKATPRKLKKARRDGQVGNTPEVGMWLGMLAATFLLPGIANKLMTTASTALVQVGGIIKSPSITRAMTISREAFTSAFTIVLPLALVIALVAVSSAGAQGGIWLAPKLLKPKFSRLNPLSGLKRMFGPHGWWTLTKSLLKTCALAGVMYVSVSNLVPKVMNSGSLQLSALVDICVSTVLNTMRYAAVAGLFMGFVDWGVVRKRNNKQLKMTRQEIKDEHKSSEGDPHVRGQRRSMQMAMRRNRMMHEVETADVVLVNPTHVAVALRYDAARGAPRVVAKGAGHTAARIRELAEKHRVPMVADVPLARTLYKNCKIGQEIPADMYKAVATVLAFIMTLKRRGSAAGVHTVRTLVPSR